MMRPVMHQMHTHARPGMVTVLTLLLHNMVNI